MQDRQSTFASEKLKGAAVPVECQNSVDSDCNLMKKKKQTLLNAEYHV